MLAFVDDWSSWAAISRSGDQMTLEENNRPTPIKNENECRLTHVKATDGEHHNYDADDSEKSFVLDLEAKKKYKRVKPSSVHPTPA